MTSSALPAPFADDAPALQARLQALEAELAAARAQLQAQALQLDEARRLRTLAARHQLVAEAARAAQWEWDLRTDRVLLSRRWGEIVGEAPHSRAWDLEELRARVHPDDLPALKEAARAAISGAAPRYFAEHRVATRDGWAWIESVGLVTARDAQGRPVHMSGYNIDITPRRQLHEEMARARAQAEASSRAKSEFVANMSHEVRTPLNAVLGLARLLHQSPLDSEQRHYVALIDSAATSLLALLNDVLDLSKVEAGRLLFEQVRFDLRQWVRDAVELHAVGARDKGLQLRLSIAEDLPEALEGDPGRLRQVISNLVANAVKFTAQGEVEVTVACAPDQSGLEADALRVHFSVRDTGIGIAPEMQGAVFDAFTQADSSITRTHGGTGLGLAICARLVALMGGQITLRSEPGRGSTFAFDAVLRRAAGAPSVLPESQPQASVVLRGLHVLLAEDHAVNVLLMRKLLESMGCRVSVAGDGAEAVRLWAEGDVDLVLMDLQMPVLSGFDAAVQIRAREAAEPALGHTPIVALTAHAMESHRQRSLAAGMDAYASKPVSPATLVQAIEQAIVAAYEWAEGAPEAAEAPGRVQAPAAPVPPPAMAQAPAPAVDRAGLLALLGGNGAALQEAARAMREDLALRLQCLQRALPARDRPALIADAHALRGALSAVQAPWAAELARTLEARVQAGDWPGAEDAAAPLLAELARVDAELQDWLRPAA
ncbi:sensor histidine kinase [Xenophilus sp. Marseille-Q4582]|uniref:sensor histidine kinase n=1 Tax=Xenophilus sp. Marseille-Q4582 TaxID=2866600 RepID=UPI001CE45494|nr:sensor histidine kinase [Xenophilus sp. Marseille-Q4582]